MIFPPGAITVTKEPGSRVSVTLESLTTAVSTEAVALYTSRAIPPTLKTVSVVNDTSLYAAAKTRVGAISNATTIPVRTSIRGIVSLFS